MWVRSISSSVGNRPSTVSGRRHCRSLPRVDRQVLRSDLRAFRHHHCRLDDVHQLPDVAGPVVMPQQVECRRAEVLADGEALSHQPDEVPGEQLDVPAPIAQGRKPQFHGAQPIVEILAKHALRDHVGEIPVGSGKDADVHVDFRGPADMPEAGRIEHPQQLHLRGEADFADLVEEDGAAVGDLEQPRLRAIGTREGAALVSEQLVLQQRLLQCRALHHDERAMAPRAARVQQLGDHLLARPGLAGDEHGGVGGRHAFDQVQQLPERRAVADERAAEIRWREPPLEQAVAPAKRLPFECPPDADVEFIERARLGDVVEGTDPDRLHGFVQRPVPGQHDDVGCRAHLPDPPQRLEAIDVRQAEIEEYHVGLVVDHATEGLRRRCGRRHREVHPLQFSSQHAPERIVIVDQQHRGGGPRRGWIQRCHRWPEARWRRSNRDRPSSARGCRLPSAARSSSTGTGPGPCRLPAC